MDFLILMIFAVLGFPICASIYLLIKVSRLNRQIQTQRQQLDRFENLITNMRKAGVENVSPAVLHAPLQQETVQRETPPVTHQQPVKPPPDVERKLEKNAPQQPASLKESAPLPESTISREPPPAPVVQTKPKADSAKPHSPQDKIPSRGFSVSGDLEKFMGVKLFSWLGGLALFLAVAFFVQYSFENNLIPPPVRIGLGFLAGIGLILGSLRLSLSKNPITVQTLCSTGIIVLYADFFASHALYHLIPSSLITFALMALVTCTSFLFAVRLEAQTVAILGLIGGFLTPVLLSTGVDNPLGLFGYLAILDVGLIAVALHRKWDHLTLLTAVATLIMQVGWVNKFFEVGKIMTAFGIFLGFAILFALALEFARRLRANGRWSEISCLVATGGSLGFVLYLLVRPYHSLAAQPGLIFSFVFLVDACFLATTLISERLRRHQWGPGAVVFILLLIWTENFLNAQLLNQALACCLAFAILHSAFPILLQRLRPETSSSWLPNLFPGLSLVLIILFVTSPSGVLPVIIWPCALLIDLIGIAVAIITGFMTAVIPIILLTLLSIALWIDSMPANVAGVTGVPTILAVIGGFALIFFIAGGYLATKNRAKTTSPDQPSSQGLDMIVGQNVLSFLPQALSATLPFFLLILVVMQVTLNNPSPVFALGALMCLLLFGMSFFKETDILVNVGLVCVLLLEYVWHWRYFDPAQPTAPLLWYLGFTALFLLFPFVFVGRFESRIQPWIAAALAGPLHFGLIYRVFSDAFPNPYMGALPAAMAIPTLAGLIFLLKRFTVENPGRTTLLALFGGATLFFVTLVFPIQFERQWITIGWALEGVALLWLFHRVPHNGLRLTGTALLTVAFVRLALNPSVFSYHPRAATPILNWYLYAYGVTSVCLMTAGRLLSPSFTLSPFSTRLSMQSVMYGMGTVLAFFLMNIEIADVFSTGATLTFNFSGNLAQDMTYSLAWAAFAFLLFMIGVIKKINPARYAGFCLLTVTLFKLLMHDLWRLGGAYRIGSLAGLALVLILVSFIYQRFLTIKPDDRSNAKDQPNETE